ncbi:flagellin N-terminal helical domain-containing protein [Azospirillum picis]|uniref:Flagellin n=1 Tax=Azospirillum picis TaxID=488438 RepID=A0ABU0MGY4_9PROT|nr:flagellin [Azospirillum picis]MBP2299087.1 flagellin-like hook-associated protein FlgL [Azospirillum picis]MDQ0532671.1 flagellin-like hook-associated protein FlgL [Azospirillum picis]
MAGNVTLSASMRTNLLQLQSTQSQIEKKQNILATGNKINTALDGPTAFFSAKGLNQRAGDLTSLKDAMGQSISTIQAADKGLTAIDSIVDQAKGLTTAAYAALGNDASSIATRKSLASQFNTLKDQIDKLASDSGYGGKNLINGNGLSMDSTSESRASVNTITGLDNARVTNVTKADTYSIRVKGDGSIEGKTRDISDAENAHGLTGLKLSGKMSTTSGSFSNVTVEVRGANGRTRDIIVGEGDESRTISYFDNTQAIEAKQVKPAKSGQAQVANINVSGTIEEGDVFTISVEGQSFSYAATSGDVAIGQDVAKNVATRLANSINNAMGAGGRLEGKDVKSVSIGGSGTIRLTGQQTAGVVRDMGITTSATNALTKHISESFASGTVVSFTVDRRLLEAANNQGNGVSTIEKKVDLQIQVTNSSGSQITRDAMNTQGDSKLSDGEQSYAFDSGTVRVNVDQKKIMQAASAGCSANLVTKQISDANSSNDITVQLNESNSSSITVNAVNLTTSGQGLQIDAAQNDWSDRADIDKAVSGLDHAKATIRSASQNLSTNLNIVTTRENFTKEFSDVLTEGASKLTLADQNEEGAGLLMLQTRQQLGTIALSLANQSQQSILRLF